MSRRKPQLFLTFFLVLLIWGLGSRIVNAAEEKAESGTGREQAETQEESGKNGRPEALTEEEAASWMAEEKASGGPSSMSFREALRNVIKQRKQ